MYVTPTRGHDATWHIHRELVLNDCMVASARRYGSKQISKRFRDVPPVPPPDPDEVAAATRAVIRISRACGLDDAARREVLEALGIVPPPAIKPAKNTER